MSELFTALLRLAFLQALAIGASHWLMLRVLPKSRTMKILFDLAAVLLPMILVVGSSVAWYGTRDGFIYLSSAIALLGLWHELPPFVTFFQRRNEAGKPLLLIRGTYPQLRWIKGGGLFSAGLFLSGVILVYANDASIVELMLFIWMALMITYNGFTLLSKQLILARITENGFLDAARFIPWDNVQAVSWNEGAVVGSELFITLREIPFGEKLRLSFARQLTWKMSREERPAVEALLQEYLPQDVLSPPSPPMPELMREAIANLSQTHRRALKEPEPLHND